MGLKIVAPDQWPLRPEPDGSFKLPDVVLRTTEDNLAQLRSYRLTVASRPEALGKAIMAQYERFIERPNPLPLRGPFTIRPKGAARFAQPPADARCTLQIEVEYFDSDDGGDPVRVTEGADAVRVAKKTVVIGAAPKEPPPEPEPDGNGKQEGPPFPGLVAIDFGTSNSTVAVYDPSVIAPARGVPPEQEERLRDLMVQWVQEPPAEALPGPPEAMWLDFLDKVGQTLGAGNRAGLVQRLRDGGSELMHEAVRQIELRAITCPEAFRRPAHARLHRIYSEVFRVPLLRSQNLAAVRLGETAKEDIPSETEILALEKPLKVEMGEKARSDRLSAFRAGGDVAALRGRFHPSPKRYFGAEDRPIALTVDGKAATVRTGQLIQAAWAHLIGRAQHAIDSAGPGARGKIRRVIVTYPTASPPQMRREIERLRDDLKVVAEVVTDYDEAISAALFFLLRELGGALDVGLEAFRVRCRSDGARLYQNLLVLDVGGGTTDLALIELTLDEIDPFQPGEDRGAGGRYYVLSPRLLGSTGHLQLGGDLATLRVFHVLKAALADHLLTLLQEGRLTPPDLLETLRRKLYEPYVGGDGKYRPGSLLAGIDRECSEGDAAYRDGRIAVETILPTCWREHPERLQAFYTLWEWAEKAKIALGSLTAAGAEPPRSFVVPPERVEELLRQFGLPAKAADPADLALTLTAEHFAHAVRPVVAEVAGITRGLLRSRLGDKETVDWLILSGQTSNLDLLHRELRQVFSETPGFVWNPERVTFVPKYAKLATAVGACLAEKVEGLVIPPERAKDLLRLGMNQIQFKIRNLFFFLPCDFLLATVASPVEVFKAGEELRLLDRDGVGKARSLPLAPQLRMTVERRDFEGTTTLWGVYHAGPLLVPLGMSADDFRREVSVVFEVDHRLQMRLYLWRGERPQYRVEANGAGLELPGLRPPSAMPVAPADEAAPAPSAVPVAPEAGPPILEWDVAVNVEQVAAGAPETVLFRRGASWVETFVTGDGRAARGLISPPLPPFPRSGRHAFYARKGDGPWQRLGEMAALREPPDYPRSYYVTLDETGALRLHAGEVLYRLADRPEEWRDEPGRVLRQELELQPRPTNEDRDPFCGVH